MARAKDVEREIEELTRSVAEGLGLELYDLVFRRNGPRWKLQVFLHRTGGHIGLADCEQVSRQLSRELDLLDPIPHTYDLEVSSPGMDRALRKPRHWRLARGQRVRLRYRDEDGKVLSTIVEVLEASESGVRVSSEDHHKKEIAFESVLSAKLEPDW